MNDEYRKMILRSLLNAITHDLTAEVNDGNGIWRNERVGSQFALSLVLWSAFAVYMKGMRCYRFNTL